MKKIEENIGRLASMHAFTLGPLNVTGGRELECVLERYDAQAQENARLRARVAELEAA